VADFAARLRALERKVDFLLDTGRIKIAIGSELAGADGKPLPPKVFEGSLREAYALFRSMPTKMEPPPVDGPLQEQ
jgi:hypothetical protein